MNKKQKKKPTKVTFSPRQKVVGVYLTLMFGVFPVFCTDGFFNIRHDRYYFFLALSLVLLAFWGLTLLAGDRKNAIGKLDFTDWAMIGFLAVCLVSTVFSIAPMEALLGTKGRNNGLILMAVYVGIYFVVSRYGRPGPIAFAALGITGAFVGLVTVLNFFSLDPLKMLEELTVPDRKIFFSTIGNKNLLSGYFCIILPVLTVLYVENNPKWLRVLSLVCLVPGFAGLMTADSDSGFLGLGVFLAVYLLWYAQSPVKLNRLFLVMTVMLMSARILGLFSAIPGVQMKNISALQQFFSSNPLGLWLTAGMAVVTLLLHWLHQKKPNLTLPKAVPLVVAALLGAAVLALVVAIIIFTAKPELPLNGIWRHLRLDDTWGTNRGFMWRRTMEIFWDFSIWRKLFGTGPDTFYFVFEPYFDELHQYWTSSTNAAHNEYLNYIITVGLFGGAAYITALVSGVVHGFRAAKKSPVALVFCGAVICYGAQALVSIAQPITTPLLILFLALCAGKENTR